MEAYEPLYMYYGEGVDSIGDPVRVLVTARDAGKAKAKIREDYEGVIKNLRIERITGFQWEDYLRGYGTKYGPLGPRGFPEDYAPEASRYAIVEGRPIFL